MGVYEYGIRTYSLPFFVTKENGWADILKGYVRFLFWKLGWSTIWVDLKMTMGLWFGGFQVDDLEYVGFKKIARNKSVLGRCSRL